MPFLARFPRRRFAYQCAILFALTACDETHVDAKLTGPDDVRAALDSSVAAWNRGDLDAHVSIYADSAVLLPAAEGRGPAQARRTLARFFLVPAERPTLALDSLQVVALGESHVLVRGQYVLVNGRVENTPRRGWFTELWAQTSQGWRIIHDHSS